MSRRPINIGTTDNDDTGDKLRPAGDKINDNFSDLFALLGADLNWIDPVRVAATGDVIIASELEAGDTVDGVVLAEGDRVLLPAQSTPSQNGIYVVPATGAAARATDADASAELSNAIVAVEEGTAGAGKLYRCDQADPIVVDTDALSFSVVRLLAVTGIPMLPSFPVASLPDPTVPGQTIYVSDEIGGAVMAFSDGIDWRRVTDRAIVS